MRKGKDGGLLNEISPVYDTGRYHVRVVVSGETVAFRVRGAGIEELEKLLKESCDKALVSIFERNPVTVESLKISEIPGEVSSVTPFQDGRCEISVSFSPDSADHFHDGAHEFAHKHIAVSLGNLLMKLRSEGKNLGDFVYTISARPKAGAAKFKKGDRVWVKPGARGKFSGKVAVVERAIRDTPLGGWKFEVWITEGEVRVYDTYYEICLESQEERAGEE